MSEVINNSEKKRQVLKKLTELVIAGEKDHKKIAKHRDELTEITPRDVLMVEDILVKEGLSIDRLKKHIEKVLNVIGPALEDHKWEKPQEENHPLNLLKRENEMLKEILGEIKDISKEIFKENKTNNEQLRKLNKKFQKLNKFNNHYVKKENILFPYLEKVVNYDKPMTVMWSLHDDIRKQIKKIIKMTKGEKFELNLFKKELAILLSLMYRMIFKEEKILFPVAYKVLKDEIWDDIYDQFIEEGFCFIDTSGLEIKKSEDNKEIFQENIINFPTGEININELEIILNSLPVELTFVGKDDRVKYFTDHEKRTFPRSKAVIGRKVQNCHPPESVHIVEKILASFKKGNKDSEHFRIKMQEKYIMINYYALRDESNEYIGTLEVTQDITEIHSYEGEKRLLDIKD